MVLALLVDTHMVGVGELHARAQRQGEPGALLGQLHQPRVDDFERDLDLHLLVERAEDVAHRTRSEHLSDDVPFREDVSGLVRRLHARPPTARTAPHLPRELQPAGGAGFAGVRDGAAAAVAEQCGRPPGGRGAVAGSPEGTHQGFNPPR